MGRSKRPEQTYERIVAASARLFSEKGYEQTSIQDILDALSLSKGGLYHHFKSKEEILDAVMQKRAQSIYGLVSGAMKNTKAQNAREKLKEIAVYQMTNQDIHQLDSVFSAQMDDPHFVVSGLQACVKQDAALVGRLIAEGVEDGSLQIAQPDLCAEVFLLLLNFWVNPSLFGRGCAETGRRLRYWQWLMSSVGLDIIDDALIAQLLETYAKSGAFQA